MPIQYPNGSSSTSSSQNPSPTKSTARSQTSDAGASARVDLNRGAPLLDWSRRHARKRSALPSAVSAVSATVTSGASVSTSTGGVTSDSHDEVVDGHVGLSIGIGVDVGGTRRMSMAENRRMLTSRPTSMLSLRSGTGVRNDSLAEDRNGTLDLTATESQSESKPWPEPEPHPQAEPKPEPDSGSPPVPALLVLPPPSPMPLLASSPLPQHSQLPQPSSPAIPPSSPSSSSPAPPLQSQPQPPSTILIPSSDTTLTPTPDAAQTPTPTPCATMAPPPNSDVTTTTTIIMEGETATEATASTSEAPTATSSTTESGTTTMTATTEGANWWRYLAWGSSTNETSSTTPVQVVHEPGPATAPEVQGQLPAPAQAQEGQPLGQEPVGAQLEPPVLDAPDRDVTDVILPGVDVSRGTELGSDVGVDGVSGPSEVVRDIGEVGVGHDVGRNVDAEVKADTDTSASMGTATGTNTDEKPAAVPSPGIGAWYTPWWRSRGGDTNTIATTDTTTLGSDANTNNNTDLNTDTNTNSDAATSPDTNNNAVGNIDSDANTQTAADAGSIITGSETLHTATATSTLGTDTLVVPASQPQPQSQSDAESSTATPSAVEQTEAQTPSQPEAPDSKPSSANVSGPTSQAGTSTTSWMALSFFSARALATRRIANSTDAGAGSGNGEGGTIRGQADGGETQEPGQAHGGTMEVMELDLDEGLDEVVGQGRDQGVNSSEAQAMDVDEVGRSPEKLSEVGDSLVATVAGPSSTTTTVANPITPMPTATSSILSLARLLPQRQSSPVPVPIPSTPNSRSSTPISSTPPSSLPQGTPPSASKISVKPSTPKSSSKPKPTPKPKPKPNLVLPTWGDTFYTPPRSSVPPLPRPIRGLEPSPSEQEKEEKEKAGMGALTQLGNLKGRVVDSARRVLALGFGGGNTGGSDATSVAGSASGGGAGNIGTLGKVGGWVGTSLLGHEDQTHHHDGEQPREGGQEWRHSAYERALPRSWDLLEGRVPRDILQPSHVPDVMATLSTPQFKHNALPTHDELRAETLNNLPEVHDVFRGCSKVVVIGVHGWFPGAVMRTVLGEPTGTSAKFVSMGVQAIEAFQARANGKVVATHTSNIDDAREATNDGIPSLANDGTRASTNDSTPAHLNDITGPQDTTNSGITVTRIPLEGEGTINARVDRLYHTLLTTPAYLAALHDADAVLIVAHSQGSVVATHILDRLVRDGHLWTGVDAGTSSEDQGDAVVQGGVGVAASDTGMGRSSPNSTPTSTWNRKNIRDRKPQRICCLAMCGVHLGPLRYLSTSSLLQPYIQFGSWMSAYRLSMGVGFRYFESTAARELFEFQNTESQISKEYLSALNNVLDHRIKMVYVASLNDQVVGLYSGLFTAVSHPLILRALYIDGDAYQSSDFLSNLLVLLLRIRNAGISDSGLIAHLSEATAGSLNGVGHSTAYEEIATYALAVDYLFRADDGSAFDSTELVEMVIEQFDALSEQNDYEIPWALRDLIANEGVVRLFADEFMRLRDAFRDWHPKTAILRDVKRKLQPIQRLSSTILTTNTPRPNANSISKL
ncbi:hypothetical protein BJ138DRAFT_1102638 [Hygrophoropsis aurantiaca]|uniref:Uncharacterized protein n=1 Tax=Hygrophoropsis aurantiaca TaxID=72124 RepID=A0ACB8A8U2_9AGAM|nr:hypothetical protein BJ138DRAFT_1102638 [Hygrophoropsis aurantiaca]